MNKQGVIFWSLLGVFMIGCLFFNIVLTSNQNGIELEKMSLLINDNFRKDFKNHNIEKILISNMSEMYSSASAIFIIKFSDNEANKCLRIEYEKSDDNNKYYTFSKKCQSNQKPDFIIDNSIKFFSNYDIRSDMDFEFFSSFYIATVNELFNFLDKENLIKEKNIKSWQLKEEKVSSL